MKEAADPHSLNGDNSALERRGEQLLKSARSLPTLDEQALDQVRLRLTNSATRRRSMALPLLAVALVLVASAAGAAGWWKASQTGSPSNSIPSPTTLSNPQREPTPAARSSIAPAESTVSPAQQPSALSEESRLLGEALRTLRQEKKPHEALQQLARLKAQFPDGTLANEVALAQAETLELLGRTEDALAALDSDATKSPRSELIRAQLLTKLQRYDEAIATLSKLNSLTSEALWTRALCYERLHRRSEFRQDLKDYLKRFPQGSHAEQARQALR